MPHLPVFLWIVLAIIPVVIGFLLYVEATVVKPSIEAERRGPATVREEADVPVSPRLRPRPRSAMG
jgi:hypothetical protein